MAGKKHKHRQRQQQRGNSTELLDELSSLRDLLGTDDLGEIPILDQVAEPAPVTAPRQAKATPPERQPVQEPLDESDLPILFSPVDEELPEDISPELNEADRALLRPLQDLPSPPAADQAVTVDSKRKLQPAEQQSDLFDPPAPKPAENPFLPAHIRARLTGGRVPRDPEPAEEAQSPPAKIDTDVELLPEPALEPQAKEHEHEHEQETAVTDALREMEQEAASRLAEGALPTAAEASAASAEDAPLEQDPQAERARERAQQRQKLVDRLVASQLPELERQLRARIELMIDELEAKR
ncbi:hypothetical protein AWR36_013315 [Microbulbifer flavimaris]|uniref:Uncharacterized protein n=1 Tax=Microbulbifer flavimaris TaxID=1781068 RepID=A0ABX4HWG2_9GAMM|nr:MULTISPECIES: hypothetical protein [Microbulbifer]KUJ81528.1 hypothetical protein AVO43_13290 [Microbulbifer sp. ZGT114]PCO04432.1 hypothetical protein AWR36_013315 [Microbulbifer flavimaris]